MKKLMMTLAAVVVATMVMADVTSENIVGYLDYGTPDAYLYKMYTPMFTTVTGTGSGTFCQLSNILPNENFGGDHGCYITFMTAEGVWTINASYYDGFGWYDPNDGETIYDDEPIVSGTGFYISTANSGGALECFGEVPFGDLEVALPDAYHYAMVGNGTPKAMELGDVEPNENFGGDHGCYITFMTTEGVWTINASYYDGFGWYDPGDGETIYDAEPLAPGDTFYVSTANDGGALIFPSPL